MIHKPPIDELAEKVGSKYSLCVVASKRARQLMEQAQNQGLNELPNKEKPLSVAAQEICDGKLIATND
ncbi:MAG: DNA-directed RNA polymerase subunit omega [Clostridia bacterium]|nr:DNA-directed RNA polymerase subunit omega [Clostridia bacterium]